MHCRAARPDPQAISSVPLIRDARAVAATLLSALLLASSCSDDDDDAADRSVPTSATTNLESEMTVPPTTGRSIEPPHIQPCDDARTIDDSARRRACRRRRAGRRWRRRRRHVDDVASGFAPVPQAPPPDEPVNEGGSGATELAVVQTCDPASPATPAVVLTWRPAAAGEQLVAIAVLPDGFETGRYTVTNQLPAEQRVLRHQSRPTRRACIAGEYSPDPRMAGQRATSQSSPARPASSTHHLHRDRHSPRHGCLAGRWNAPRKW